MNTWTSATVHANILHTQAHMNNHSLSLDSCSNTCARSSSSGSVTVWPLLSSR
eukprot:m.50795 g.50795  ORF g.50795 m.50795 type:complete len:53 (-) comp10911_c0_seq1:1842-2000(-)